jgi:gamma-glutamyltranspeptidase/glutathione hydrolase
MVVSNHPLASVAGAEMLAAGGNAIDAAIATLFTLTVVEPMMVGIIGGGMAHIRLADGSHRFVDGQSTVPLAVKPDTYRSKPGAAHDLFDTVDNENLNGPKAVAVPGSLKAWCETLQRFGTMPLADVMGPAINHASRGFAATPYLHECIVDGAREMLKDNAISAIYLRMEHRSMSATAWCNRNMPRRSAIFRATAKRRCIRGRSAICSSTT